MHRRKRLFQVEQSKLAQFDPDPADTSQNHLGIFRVTFL